MVGVFRHLFRIPRRSGLGVGTFSVPTPIAIDTQNSAYFHKTGGFDGITNDDTGIVAFKIKFSAADASNVIIANQQGTFEVQRTTSNKIRVTLFDAAFANEYTFESTNAFDSSDGLLNVLITWNVSTTTYTSQIHVNDAAETVVEVNDSATAFLVKVDETDNWAVNTNPSSLGNNVDDICLGDLYMHIGEELDFTTESNRRLFFNAGGAMVYKGLLGQIPTGNQPILFLSSTIADISSWQNNRGSGGGLTLTDGPLIECPATTPISDILDLRWDILESIQDTLDLRWNILENIQDILDLRWNILSSISDTIDLRWNILQNIQDTLDLRWNMSGNVQDVLDLRWDMSGNVQDTLSLQWNILNNIQDIIDLRWDILQNTQDTIDFRWDITGNILDTLDLRWDIPGATSVQDILDLRWNMAGSILDTLDLRWELIETLSIGQLLIPIIPNLPPESQRILEHNFRILIQLFEAGQFGQFTTVDGKTVTVEEGLITDIN